MAKIMDFRPVDAAIAADPFQLRDAVHRLTDSIRAMLPTQQAAIADASITAIMEPTDSPASADALRDDLVAVCWPSINNRLNICETKINAILAALRAVGIIAT